jgi:hypothetical protein
VRFPSHPLNCYQSLLVLLLLVLLVLLLLRRLLLLLLWLPAAAHPCIRAFRMGKV